MKRESRSPLSETATEAPLKKFDEVREKKAKLLKRVPKLKRRKVLFSSLDERLDETENPAEVEYNKLVRLEHGIAAELARRGA